jgi:hypothetical protein
LTRANQAIAERWSATDCMKLAAPQLVELAERHFGRTFRQASAWG